jgi:hypothetical protein
MLLAGCFAVVLCLMGCGKSHKGGNESKAIEGKTYYLKYNLHYYMMAKDTYGKASVVNYTDAQGHAMLPYNSQVTVELHSKAFTVIDSKGGTKVEVDCPSKFAQKTPAEYVDLVMSTSPVSYSGLSGTDRKGITEGKALNGMSKTGVMVALGYPAPFATPSLDSDTWQYWRNKFVKFAVNFKNDAVVSTGKAE